MIEWNDSMSVGVAEFDDHHKRIMALINKLEASVQKGDDPGITNEVLAEVSNYTVYHFFAEEEVMEKYAYPGYEQHRQEHIALTSRAFQLMSDAQTGGAVLGQDVLTFLVGWLKNHILGTDKKYEPFFRDLGLS